MIYILAGPVRTGKTSALLEWCYNRNDADGVVCPDNKNGKRYFLNIKSKETYILEIEAEAKSDKIVSIGPFHFLKKAFDKANEYLINLIDKDGYSYIIIDELGKLELQNQGLYFASKKLIQDFMYHDKQHLIVVVRKSLLDRIINHFDILKYQIIKKEDLIKKRFS